MRESIADLETTPKGISMPGKGRLQCGNDYYSTYSGDIRFSGIRNGPAAPYAANVARKETAA